MTGPTSSRRATIATRYLVSLLLGGLLGYLAMKDWSWGEIYATLRSLQGRATWIELHTPLDGSSDLEVLKDGARLAVFPRARGARFAVPVSDPRGLWSLRVTRGGQVQAPPVGWRVMVAPPRGEAGDPMAFPASSAGGGPLAARVSGIRWSWLLPYVLVFAAVHLVRLLRWGILLEPLGKIRITRLIAVGSVGFMAILLLPLRLGEFVRPYLVSRESRIPMTSALATCVTERMIDGLSVSLLLFLVLAGLPAGSVPPAILSAGYLALATFLGALLFLLGLYLERDLTIRLIQATVGRLLPGFSDKIVGMASSFIDGLQTLPSLRAIGLFLASTALYWGLNGLGFFFVFQAVGLTDQAGSPLGIGAGYTVMAILAIGIIVPGGPAFAGNFEFSMALGLGLFLSEAVLSTRGAIAILLVHLLQVLLQVGVGLVFLVTGQVSLHGALDPDLAPSPPT